MSIILSFNHISKIFHILCLWLWDIPADTLTEMYFLILTDSFDSNSKFPMISAIKIESVLLCFQNTKLWEAMSSSLSFLPWPLAWSWHGLGAEVRNSFTKINKSTSAILRIKLKLLQYSANLTLVVISQVWWCMPVSLHPGELRQEHCKCKPSAGNSDLARPHLKTENKKGLGM